MNATEYQHVWRHADGPHRSTLTGELYYDDKNWISSESDITPNCRARLQSARRGTR
jgi:hypothetical protein